MIQELKCSNYIRFLTYFMITFPFTYLVIAGLFFELNSKGLLSNVLSPLFYLASFFWIITGLGLVKLKKTSWYTLIMAQLFTTYLNAINLVEYSNSDFKVWAFAFTILIQTYVFVAISNTIRVPYFFPKIKWWESDAIGLPQMGVTLNHLSSKNGNTQGMVLDISAKGCFIKTHHDFPAAEKITLNFDEISNKTDISGIIVWNAKSTVTHPKGIGVKFDLMDRKKRKIVRVIVRRFIKQKEPVHAKKLSA